MPVLDTEPYIRVADRPASAAAANHRRFAGGRPRGVPRTPGRLRRPAGRDGSGSAQIHSHRRFHAPLPLFVTHSGIFHCDDAFAHAVLRFALGLAEPDRDHTLTRTRDPAVIAAADYVWDVGALYDAAAGRFDHHQRGAPRRADGLPLSAAGLVWQTHGEAAVRAPLAPEAATHGTMRRASAGC